MFFRFLHAYFILAYIYIYIYIYIFFVVDSVDPFSLPIHGVLFPHGGTAMVCYSGIGSI